MKTPTLRLHLKKIEAQASLILLICRDAEGRRYTVQVNDFRAYFYVPQSEVATLKKRALDYEVGLPAIDGTPTYRVFVDSPASVSKRRKGFARHFEADVPYTRRFLVDTGIQDGFEVSNYVQVGDAPMLIAKVADLKPVSFRTKDRQMLYDIETKKPDGSKHYSPPVEAAGAVTCLTFHDNFLGERVYTHYWHPERGTIGRPKIEIRSQWSDGYQREIEWRIHTYGSEEEMHVAILQYLKKERPDVMQAWNGHHGHHRKNTGGFDAPYMINRLRKVGLTPGQLSPLGTAFAGYKVFGKETETTNGGRFQCEIAGVQLVDGMCVGAEHLILRPDLTWTKAGDLRVGDKVASFDAKPTEKDSIGRAIRRRYSIGIVTQNKVENLEAFEVELADGAKITTTADHPWLVKNYDNALKWVKTKNLNVAKNRAVRVIRPASRRDDWDAGWLSGMYDGEGSLQQSVGPTGTKLGIVISQKPGIVMNRIQELLTKYGYEFGVSVHRFENNDDVHAVQINGGHQERLRLLQELRPLRLLNKFKWEKLGIVMTPPQCQIEVIAVRPVGMRPIARMSVDCETYIAEGFLMHNTTYQVKEGGFTAQVPFSDLKRVSAKFGRKKLKKDPTRDFNEWWLNDTEEFLTYSFNDVDALIDLEISQGYLEWAREIQQFVGCEDTNKVFAPMALITTMILRIAKEDGVCIPTADAEREDYEAEGGYVLDPRVKGVQRRVGVLDLSTMYVNNIISGNLSPETHVPNPTDDQIKDLICVPSDLGPQFFLKPSVKVGLIPKACLRFKAVREKFDVLIKASTSAAEIKELKHKRQPAKQLLLGVWGTTLSPFFALFKPEVGSSITGMGRYIIHNLDEETTRLKDHLVYGDTDSNFIPLPGEGDRDEKTVEHGMWLAEKFNSMFNRLTKSMNMDTHTFKIGLEAIWDPFVMGETKKMYAGYVVWAEGKWQDPPVFMAVGIPGIKSDAAPITKEMSESVLKAMLNGVPPLEILDHIRTVHDGVLNGSIPLDDIIKAVGLNADIDNEKVTNTNVVRGARHGKAMYDFEYPPGIKVRVVKLKGGEEDWIAIPDGEDIPEGTPVDMEHHAQLAVLNPLQNLLQWIDVTTDSIKHGTSPTVQRRL